MSTATLPTDAAASTAVADASPAPSPPAPQILDYATVRALSLEICAGLQPEDFVPQPVPDVSPAKWHLAHTTWFFETFVLAPHLEGYNVFDEAFAFLFNSYYEAAGPRILRTQRGNMTRPTTAEVLQYRAHVDAAVAELFCRKADDKEVMELVQLGLHHEQQHQELMRTDILYTLGHNPLFPVWGDVLQTSGLQDTAPTYTPIPAGLHHIGHHGPGFHFDNELGRHRVFLEAYEIATSVVTCGQYLSFMEAGGYTLVEHWLSEGWAFAKTLDQHAPLHWHRKDGQWHRYTPAGLLPLDPDAPLAHVSYYEADAYARWAGARLPTEFEWESAHAHLDWGQVWEWTSSAYGPYPGFRTAPGALGEYNGKWMVNQQVLRGASAATSPGHSRPTYRNFFPASKRWQYSGIRLARDGGGA